ncbi:MAG: nuclear transport factor 2 family protein [Pseudomonadota bacterium]
MNKTVTQHSHHPTEISTNNVPTAITAVIEEYFDALYEASESKMGAIFHTSGVYATADESPVLIRDKPSYLNVLRQRTSPASREETRKDSIDSIEMAGENTARAIVRCSIGNSDFIDFLTLVRDEGRWQIIAKIFHIA